MILSFYWSMKIIYCTAFVRLKSWTKQLRCEHAQRAKIIEASVSSQAAIFVRQATQVVNQTAPYRLLMFIGIQAAPGCPENHARLPPSRDVENFAKARASLVVHGRLKLTIHNFFFLFPISFKMAP